MRIFSKTDKGMVRDNNQDAFFAGKLGEDCFFAIVCDGMGGANAGNVASETAVKKLSEYIIKSYRKSMTNDDVCKMLKNSVESVNILIYDKALKNPELNGMGTTAVIAVAQGNNVVIAHVGDSRAYLINEEITQITRDHSVVQSLIESGKLSAVEAKNHPRKNVITRAIGAEESVSAECDELTLKSGDFLLLCTDGLSNFADAEDIKNAFSVGDVSLVAERLIDIANKNGGRDNVTAVVLNAE